MSSIITIPTSVTCMENVTLHGKTDTNAFPFKLQNRLLSVYIRLSENC